MLDWHILISIRSEIVENLSVIGPVGLAFGRIDLSDWSSWLRFFLSTPGKCRNGTDKIPSVRLPSTILSWPEPQMPKGLKINLKAEPAPESPIVCSQWGTDLHCREKNKIKASTKHFGAVETAYQDMMVEKKNHYFSWRMGASSCNLRHGYRFVKTFDRSFDSCIQWWSFICAFYHLRKMNKIERNIIRTVL